MAEMTSYDEGAPCWVDLGAPDVDQAKEFYTKLFGWAYIDTGEAGGGYQLATLRGKQVAGLGPKPQNPGPSAWTVYLWVNDAAAAAARVNEAGGTVFMQPMDVPNAGRVAVVADSTGAVFGLWQGREHRGAQLANEPGSFTWNENLNEDPAKARAFYEQAFGYSYEELGDWAGEYHVFKINGEVRGGIGAKPPQVPAGTANYWNTYFSVTDTDASVAVVQRNGGVALLPPFDTPVGRMAVVTDPGGAQFSLIAAPNE
jgi:predicted enzyme related to lactoylglutathione lyase